MRAETQLSSEELERRVAERTRRLEALYEISDEISSQLNINRVLHSVTEKAQELLDSDIAFLCLLDEGDASVNLRSTSGSAEAICARCALADEPAIQQVLHADGTACAVDEGSGSCGIVSAQFRRSHLAAPLRVQGRVIGALCVGDKDAGHFSEDDRKLLAKLANSAAIALENARLYEQAEQTAVLEERQRLTAQMHDDLLQSLSYVRIKLHQLAEQLESGVDTPSRHVRAVEQIGEHIDTIAHEMRETILGLQTPPQPAATLQQELAELIVGVNAQSAVPIELATDGGSPLILSADTLEHVTKIAREALLNATHHAGADSITMTVTYAAETAELTVVDDGAGFDPEAPPTDGSHFGLKVMRARAARIGGRLDIDSEPGGGTKICLRWPLDGAGPAGYAQ